MTIDQAPTAFRMNGPTFCRVNLVLNTRVLSVLAQCEHLAIEAAITIGVDKTVHHRLNRPRHNSGTMRTFPALYVQLIRLLLAHRAAYVDAHLGKPCLAVQRLLSHRISAVCIHENLLRANWIRQQRVQW